MYVHYLSKCPQNVFPSNNLSQFRDNLSHLGIIVGTSVPLSELATLPPLTQLSTETMKKYAGTGNVTILEWD